MGVLVLIWGTAFAALRELSAVLDPYQLTWFRYLPMLLAYPVWIALRRRPQLTMLGARGWAAMGGLGILGVAGYHLPFNWAIQPRGDEPGASAAIAAILVATAPLWALLWSVLLRKEQFSAKRGLGFAIAFLGVVVVVMWGRGAVDVSLAKRALVLLIAPASWTLYSVLAKPFIERIGGLTVTGLTMAMGALMFAPWQAPAGVSPLAAFTPRLWLWLAFVAVLATAAGYAMWNSALRHLPATSVASYIYLIPVVATTTGYLLLGETVTPWFLAGAALIIGGVWWVNRTPASPAQAVDASAGTS